MRKLFSLFVLVSGLASAQFYSFPTYRFWKIQTLPTTCTTGDVAFQILDATYYKCAITNTWTALGSSGSVTTTIASGAKALATTLLTSAACTSAQTATATGTLTTDTVIATFNADPTGVTGFTPVTTGALTIFVYPTADAVNFKVCNLTSSSVTPGAITINWRVVR